MKHFRVVLFLLLALPHSCAVQSLTGSSTQPIPALPVISPPQNREPEKDSQGKVGLLTRVSPHAIKRYVETHKGEGHVSLSEFWQVLDIPVEEWREYGNCQVRVFNLGYTGTNPIVMLRLYDDSGWSQGGTRYVFFSPQTSSAKKQWKYLGYIDLDEQRYRIPRQRFVSSGKHRWFVVEALSGRGTGYHRYDSLWFEFTNEGLKEVLSYESDMVVMWDGVPLTISIRATVEGVTSEGRGGRIVVLLNNSFMLPGDGNQETLLWVNRQKVTFIRGGAEGAFHFDASQSQPSKAEYKAIYEAEDIGPAMEDVLRYNYSHLEEIARGKDRQKKKWLSLYLDQCCPTPEKEKLLALLDR